VPPPTTSEDEGAVPIIIRIAILALALIATGCSRVSDGQGGDDARLLVTADRGATRVADTSVRADQSVMDAVRAITEVKTAYGGGFVDSMFDRDTDAGAQRGWLYFVNGMSPGHGANEQTVRRGDVIWWDHHDWGGQPTSGGVVGSWPEPFINGYPSPPEGVSADPPLDEPLRRAGATLLTTDAPWRIRVDESASLARRDPAWRNALARPQAVGLTVRIVDGRVEALATDGTTFKPVANGRAVAALIPTGATADDGGALLAVAGVDRESAERAAATIASDPMAMRAKFAVVFDGDGQPIAAGGQVEP